MAGLSPVAEETVALSGMQSLFRRFSSVDEAVEQFQVGVRAQEVGGVVVASIIGDLDAGFTPKVEAELRKLISAEQPRLVIDFSKVNYIASAGLRVLQVIVMATRARGGDVRLAGLTPPVFEVFDMTGFTPVFKLFDDTQAAVSSFA